MTDIEEIRSISKVFASAWRARQFDKDGPTLGARLYALGVRVAPPEAPKPPQTPSETSPVNVSYSPEDSGRGIVGPMPCIRCGRAVYFGLPIADKWGRVYLLRRIRDVDTTSVHRCGKA